MCCRVTVSNLDPLTAAAVLEVGQFRLESGVWRRWIEEERCHVTARMGDTYLSLSIEPTISMDSHHDGKRITAGVYFEIAAKYAEKVGGTITQHSNIGACRQGGSGELVLAEYPSSPLDWSKICNGFQRVILGG